MGSTKGLGAARASSLLVAALLSFGVGWLLWRSIFEGQAQTFDTLLYARSLWGLAHGEPINSVAGVHAFGIHGHFVLGLLVPFAWLTSSAAVLIVAQATSLFITVGLVAWAFCDIALDRGWSSLAIAGAGSLAVILASLGSPAVLNPFLFDARPDLLGLPLCVAGLLRAERTGGFDRWSLALLFASLLAREELAMVVAAAALTAPARSGLLLKARERVLAASIAAGYWGLYWYGLREVFGGVAAVERVQGTPSLLIGASAAATELGLGEIARYKLEILLVCGLAVGGLAARGWRWLGVAAPGVLFLLLNNRLQAHVLSFHYAMFAAPGLLVAAVAGFRAVAQGERRAMRAQLVAGVVIGAASFAWSSAAPGGGRFLPIYFDLLGRPGLLAHDPEVAEARAVLRAIPPGSGAAIPYGLAAPFADRKTIWDVAKLPEVMRAAGQPPTGIDYVALPAKDWATLGRYLVEQHDFEPARVIEPMALLARDRSTHSPWSELARAPTSACRAPVARWPSAGLVLCEAGRFRDGRITLVVQRVAPPDPELAGLALRLGATLASPPQTIDFTTLRGLVNARRLPVGRAIRLLGEGPAAAFEGEVTLSALGVGPVAAAAPVIVRIPSLGSSGAR